MGLLHPKTDRPVGPARPDPAGPDPIWTRPGAGLANEAMPCSRGGGSQPRPFSLTAGRWAVEAREGAAGVVWALWGLVRHCRQGGPGGMQAAVVRVRDKEGRRPAAGGSGRAPARAQHASRQAAPACPPARPHGLATRAPVLTSADRAAPQADPARPGRCRFCLAAGGGVRRAAAPRLAARRAGRRGCGTG
jgi:hypothetical protein